MIMDNQLEVINKFLEGSKYYLIRHDSNSDNGKIINDTELKSINLTENEVYRSIAFDNDDMLFVLDLKPKESNYVMNSYELIGNTLADARAIDRIYPNIFKWCFDGISIKGYAIVNSSSVTEHTTITRYGGTEMFIKILKQHLINITKMYNNINPNYNFLNIQDHIIENELCIGSINKKSSIYSVAIDLSMTVGDIIDASTNNQHSWTGLNKLVMKYWAKEINPDLLRETEHVKLKHTIPLDVTYNIYPPCILNLINLQNKGNYNRFLLTRFLLSVHDNQDAKFVFNSVLSTVEEEHIKVGNCSTQWNYIKNNLERYSAPNCKQMCKFCDKSCKLKHPLENIQKKLEEIPSKGVLTNDRN